MRVSQPFVLAGFVVTAALAAGPALSESVQKIPIEALRDEAIVYQSDGMDEIVSRITADEFPDYIYLSEESQNGLYRIHSPDGSVSGWIDPMNFDIDRSAITEVPCEPALAQAGQDDAKGIAGACPDE